MKLGGVRKSTVVLWAFTLYSVVVYACFIPCTSVGTGRIWLTVIMNAFVIVLLWWLYRCRERHAGRGGKPTVSRDKIKNV